MKKYCAKVIVKIKPSVKDVKGLTLKQAVESIMPVEDLICRVGNFYELNFLACSLNAARETVEKIAQEILFNEVIEVYEIIDLKECDEQ